METRCPAIEHPDLPQADPALLDGLIARLADPAPVTETAAFALGTLQPDGRVDLCKQGLRGEGLARLLPAVIASPHAEHLLLGTNGLGSAAAFALPEGHGLRTLYLGCNKISAETATAIAGHLAADTEVRALWLKRNPIGDAGVTAVAATLRHNTTLRTLDLVNTGVTAAGLRALLDALLDRPVPVERLFLGGNGLGPDVAAILAALVREAGVRELYLPSNHLGDDGAEIIAAATDPARPLKLGLGGNGLTARGVTALAAALPGLESLDLGRPPSQRALGAPDNVLGDEGVTALAQALPGSPISRLELRHTAFTGRAAKALLGSVRAGTRLEYVGLGPGLPRKVKRGLAEHLRPAAPVHPDLHAIGSVYR